MRGKNDARLHTGRDDSDGGAGGCFRSALDAINRAKAYLGKKPDPAQALGWLAIAIHDIADEPAFTELSIRRRKKATPGDESLDDVHPRAPGQA